MSPTSLTTDTGKASSRSEAEPAQSGSCPDAGTITVAELSAAVSLSPTVQTTAAPPEAARFRESSQTDVLPNDAPTVLGQVTVAVGDTLGSLIQKVYGVYTYRYHQAVLEANPTLADPDRLDVGQLLTFPALSADTTDMPEAIRLIALSREPDLGAAVSILRREADGPLPLRLLVSWTPEESLIFRIALKTCFENQDAAELERSRIVPMVSAPPDIICLKESDTRFYGSLGEIKGFFP